MKFATTKQHRDFFHKEGWIEFEGCLSNEQTLLANQAIDQVMADRLHVLPHHLHLLSSEKLYLQGRDLWRSHPLLHKLATRVYFGEIAAELVEKNSLRLGYDQLFSSERVLFPQEVSSWPVPFLQQILSLETVSCLQGVMCGLLLALGGKEHVSQGKSRAPGIDIFPSEAGRIIFFRADIPVDWGRLRLRREQRFYMIVYTQALAHYRLEPQDPHTHALKHLGYVFNDKLRDKFHPMVYRR